MTQASAIVFDAPSTLSVKALELKPFDTEDLEVDVSGDGSSMLNSLISRLAPGSEVMLAAFCKQGLGFAFAPAFMREATLRIAAQLKKHDLLAVTALVERGALSLEGLITHIFDPGRAREACEVAFGVPQCLKKMIDWQA